MAIPDKTKEILAKATERGFDTTMHSPSHDWYGMVNSIGICLKLYPETEEFMLVHLEGFFELTSGKCGSFMSDKHFDGMLKQFTLLVCRLKGLA